MDRSLGDGGMALLGQLGVSFTSYGEGWVEARWVPTEAACNPLGPVHGGVYAVVHDAAMNFATNSALEKGDRCATISITYSTMRGAAGWRRARGARRGHPPGPPDRVPGDHRDQRRRRAGLEGQRAVHPPPQGADGMTTRTVVVGGGIMGAGIAYEARVAGCPVTIVEAKPELLEAAEQRVAHYESRARAKGAELDGFGPLDLSTDLAAAAANADVIVEAVSEDLGLKSSIFETVGAAANDDAVLASNTSGLPIEVLGAASGRPGQVVGTHFFNPVPAMRLVEVVRSVSTTDETVSRALAFCHALGKETVEIRDLPGFVTTRLGTLLMCEADRVHTSRASHRPRTSIPR